jgi:hypothetical protein
LIPLRLSRFTHHVSNPIGQDARASVEQITSERPVHPALIYLIREFRKGACVTMSGKTSEQVIIENQEKILANQEQVLANQRKLEEIIKNQTAIIENQEKLDKIMANQELILKNQEKILAK